MDDVLAKRIAEKSPFIKIDVGGQTEVMVYRGWKEVVGRFGDTFRYAFDVETSNGLSVKTFDNPSENLGKEFVKIPFGSKVVIKRIARIDDTGKPLEGKSYYKVEVVK